MPISFQGGTQVPTQGTPAYNAALSAQNSGVSGTGSFNPTTGVLSVNGSTLFSPSSSVSSTPAPYTPAPISTDTLGTGNPINLPTKPTPAPVGNLMASNNVGLVSSLSSLGYSLSSDGQFTYTPPAATTTPENPNTGLLANLKEYLGLQTPPPSTADIYNSLPEKAAFEEAQQNVKNYTSQLNTITANANANKLSLVGQGRGVPEAIIGGQQAQIEREAAIQALPVQAQLVAAQGNLELAQSHLDTVFKLKAEDAQNQYNYKTKLLDSVFEFANKAEQNNLELQKTKVSENFTLLQNTLTSARDLALKLTENGQANVGAKITQAIAAGLPDPSSPDFAAQYAKLNSVIGTASGQALPSYQKVTDAFGNETFVRPGISGSATPTSGTTTTSGTTGKNNLTFAQYGTLANTDFNPNNQTDTLAQAYLDRYIKLGVVPTASTLGRGIKPAAFAAVDARARDLYFKATGTNLPNPEIIAGYQKIINSNNNFANNLKTQEQTVKANFGLSLENLKNSDLNTTNINAVNTFIDNVKQYWLGNPEAAQYALQNSTVQNEIASLLAVRNAVGTTVHDKLLTSGLIDKGATLKQQKAILQTLLTEADNAKSSLSMANSSLYKQVDPFMQDPNNPLRQAELNKQNTGNQASGQITKENTKVEGLKATLPDGSVLTFPSLQAVQQFIKDHGL